MSGPGGRQPDWIDTSTRAAPVLVMMAGFVGFAGAIAKALVTGDPDLGLMGICALAGSGGYFVRAAAEAFRSGTPPPLPEAPPVPSPPPLPEMDTEPPVAS